MFWKLIKGRTLRCALALTLLLGSLLAGRPAAAQGGQRCFAETGYCISGRFLQFWQQNGGLAVFGLPLSAAIQENGRTVQYFERQRFELHPEKARPYDVLLGRLGAEALSAGAPAPEAGGPSSGCIWFPETRHNVCNQPGGLRFASYWQQHGLEFDGRPAGTNYQESLALFGYPLTEAYDYTLPDGRQVIAQWFERARFEWHSNNPDPYKVLLGRLGAEARPWTPGPWTPPPAGGGQVSEIKIFLISQGGGIIGCGDTAVPVVRRIAPTTAPLTAALNELLGLKSQTIGESGLYNALWQSDLRLSRVAVVNGQAQIDLVGQARLGGTCDTPRVIAQIEQTARQFATVNSVAITLNGQPIQNAL
jgi:hypothetical protein